MISIIIPVLNEGSTLSDLLQRLAAWRAAGDEVLVVDGGSTDDTVSLSEKACDGVLNSERGRARQMMVGAGHARGELLWFVHADSLPTFELRDALLNAIAEGSRWGRFDVSLDDPAWSFRVIERMMNWRSRVTGIATGDQAIFVARELFIESGGYPLIALMEDIELSRRLGRLSRPACLRATIGSSPRRWRNRGIVRTVIHMWALRLAWFGGVPATTLARWYGYR